MATSVLVYRQEDGYARAAAAAGDDDDDDWWRAVTLPPCKIPITTRDASGPRARIPSVL